MLSRYRLVLLAAPIVSIVPAAYAQDRAAAPPPVTVKAAPAPAADDFFMPLPPRFVAGPIVFNAVWSPDGRYVAAVASDMDLKGLPAEGEEPPMTVSLVIWSASTHRSVTVWSAPGPNVRIDQVAWMPGSAIAFATGTWSDETGSTQSGLWRVDARRSGATKVEGFGQGDLLFVSPTQPYAFVFGSKGGDGYLKQIAANGTIGSEIPLSTPAGYPAGWSKDGRSLVLPPLHKAPEGSGGAPGPWQICDGRSGRVTTSTTPPAMYEAPVRTWPFKVSLEHVKVGGTNDGPSSPWTDNDVTQAWLEQKAVSPAGNKPDGTRLLISADARSVEISPRGDALLYLNREGAFVIGLLRLPKAVMDKARTAAQRTQLLSNGKQVALGVIMWSADHDDILPPADGLKEALQPYLRSDTIFQGVDGSTFVYSLNGGSMSDIKNPANTMMGYIQGPGGYAVVYADGHVVWSTTLPETTTPQ